MVRTTSFSFLFLFLSLSLHASTRTDVDGSAETSKAAPVTVLQVTFILFGARKERREERDREKKKKIREAALCVLIIEITLFDLDSLVFHSFLRPASPSRWPRRTKGHRAATRSLPR